MKTPLLCGLLLGVPLVAFADPGLNRIVEQFMNMPKVPAMKCEEILPQAEFARIMKAPMSEFSVSGGDASGHGWTYGCSYMDKSGDLVLNITITAYSGKGSPEQNYQSMKTEASKNTFYKVSEVKGVGTSAFLRGAVEMIALSSNRKYMYARGSGLAASWIGCKNLRV